MGDALFLRLFRNITVRTFSSYISVYDFKRAVEDGAAVPLYYENRGEKIANLHNPKITEQILDVIENADLDVDKQKGYVCLSE